MTDKENTKERVGNDRESEEETGNVDD